MARTTGPADDERTRLRHEFAALPFASRRAVARAVNRGRPVEDRALAVHAVVLARRQQRLWRWLWLTGPLIGVTQIQLGWQVASVATVASTLTMALVARWWFLRARRAEATNLEQVPKRQRHRVAPRDPTGDR